MAVVEAEFFESGYINRNLALLNGHGIQGLLKSHEENKRCWVAMSEENQELLKDGKWRKRSLSRHEWRKQSLQRGLEDRKQTYWGDFSEENKTSLVTVNE